MTPPVHMFLFELAVEQLKSFTKSTHHMIRARFGEVFTLKLKDPNDYAKELALQQSQKARKKKMKKKTVEKRDSSPVMTDIPGGTVLVSSNTESLVQQMMQYPIELAVYSKDNPYSLGLAEIPWSSEHIEYVKEMDKNRHLAPAVTKELHKIYDEYTSKRVVAVKLRIKVSIIETPNIDAKPHDNLGPAWKLQDLEAPEQMGVVKTIYTSGQPKYRERTRKRNFDDRMAAIENDDKVTDSPSLPCSPFSEYEEVETFNAVKQKKSIESIILANDNNKVYFRKDYYEGKVKNYTPDNSLASLVLSQTTIGNSNSKLMKLSKHWSSSSLEIKQRLDTLNYIFGNTDGPFGNQVYCVGYFTVANDGAGGSKPPPEKKEDDPNYKFKICGNECTIAEGNPCFDNTCKLDLPKEMSRYITVKKCEETALCNYKQGASTLLDKEEPIMVTFEGPNAKDCCLQKVEEIIGGTMTTKMTPLDDPCLCTCECTFGIVKKTTYCAICGGYELPGDEIEGKRVGPPFPCPIYHKLTDNKGRKSPGSKFPKTRSLEEAKSTTDEKKSLDTDRESGKKKKLRHKDDRFKFNYGYKGIPPTIGHSKCAIPCTGYPVPKHMGWLWTADNVPGLKPRPGWRPGAANKHVVRKLRVARFPEKLHKKKKKDEKKKRSLKRPLLVVEKKDGEYFVTMETMKTYAKPRAVNQAPYEEKPLISYKIGRSDEENKERAKRKARAQRRLEREKRAFIQSTFHDMCREICLKTYQQALGMMPFAEDPLCGCYPLEPPPDRIDYSHSCSCTESERSSASATDDDEWTIEFTPPIAYFDPGYTGKRVLKSDNETQYSYLDYRVKKLDRYGNQVPRYFTGLDGQKLCSDLGGFFGPDGKWYEINVDGIIGDDGRWHPNNFIGPCGEQVDAENGKFQATNAVFLMAGVDGYIDSHGKWNFYPKDGEVTKDPKKQVKNIDAWVKAGGCRAQDEVAQQATTHPPPQGAGAPKRRASDATWSCFGNASPRALTHMGIIGHGHDRRLLLSTLERMIAQGEDVKIPRVPRAPAKTKTKKTREARRNSLPDKNKCKHHAPSTKGIIAVNDHGHKIYFKLKDYHNTRPKQRVQVLDEEGISLSSYHVPCFSSFISGEETRQRMLAHIQRHNERVMQNMGIQTH